MEHNQPHTAENRLLYAVHDLVADSRVAHMSPPKKHVRICQNLLGQTVLGHIKRCCADLDIVTFDHTFQITVDTAGIKLRNAGIAFFVKIFIPNRNFHQIFLRNH